MASLENSGLQIRTTKEISLDQNIDSNWSGDQPWTNIRPAIFCLL